jgi:hypothetical protein
MPQRMIMAGTVETVIFPDVKARHEATAGVWADACANGHNH